MDINELIERRARWLYFYGIVGIGGKIPEWEDRSGVEGLV